MVSDDLDRGDPDPPPEAEAPPDAAHPDPRESGESDQLPETAQREVADESNAG
jgi:hypothetical protein